MSKERKLYERMVVGKVSKVDLLNMNNVALSYKDAYGREPEEIVGMCIGVTDDEENGGTVNTSYILFASGVVVGGISSTAVVSIIDAVPIFDEMRKSGEVLKCTFQKGVSNSNREFVQVVFSE